MTPASGSGGAHSVVLRIVPDACGRLSWLRADGDRVMLPRTGQGAGPAQCVREPERAGHPAD
jgi:hypothetical protein